MSRLINRIGAWLARQFRDPSPSINIGAYVSADSGALLIDLAERKRLQGWGT